MPAPGRSGQGRAYGISQTDEVLVRRSTGMALTLSTLAIAALANLLLLAV